MAPGYCRRNPVCQPGLCDDTQIQLEGTGDLDCLEYSSMLLHRPSSLRSREGHEVIREATVSDALTHACFHSRSQLSRSQFFHSSAVDILKQGERGSHHLDQTS